MNSLNIILYDVNEDIKILLENDPQIRKIDYFKSKDELIEGISKKNYDICIINPQNCKLSLLDFIKEMNSKKISILISMEKPSDIEKTIEGLSNGAFDYFYKPIISLMDETETANKINEIIIKLKLAKEAQTKLDITNTPIYDKYDYDFKNSSKKLVIIGSSTGGPQSLEKIIPTLPEKIPCPIIVVQHMPEDFTAKFAERLNSISKLHVKEVEEGEELKDGICYVAKGNYHLRFKKLNDKLFFSLDQKEKIHGTRPSIDIMIESAAKYYKKNLLGIILTGMGTDGTIGAKKIKENGGTVLVQSEKTSIIFGMPKSVIEHGYYDAIVDLEKIPMSMLQILEV